MRRLRLASNLASSAFVIPLPALHAQSIATGIDGIDWAGIVQKRPYTATWIQKSVRNAIPVEELTTSYARDSSGRIYEEFQNIGKEAPFTAAGGFVYDPVAHTVTRLNSNTKQAIVTHYADSDASAVPKLLGTRSANAFGDSGFGIEGADFSAVKPEDLGAKTIAGVKAQGTPLTTTQVIRGWQPLTVTIETRWSTGYGVLLQKIYSPHYVSSATHDLWSNTLEVTAFKPCEPDAALFRVPDGYTVRDVVQ